MVYMYVQNLPITVLLNYENYFNKPTYLHAHLIVLAAERQHVLTPQLDCFFLRNYIFIKMSKKNYEVQIIKVLRKSTFIRKSTNKNIKFIRKSTNLK